MVWAVAGGLLQTAGLKESPKFPWRISKIGNLHFFSYSFTSRFNICILTSCLGDLEIREYGLRFEREEDVVDITFVSIGLVRGGNKTSAN